MERNPALQTMLDAFRRTAFGRDGSDGCCVTCGSDKTQPDDFKDDLSRKEFGISNMCQRCQDGVFEARHEEFEADDQPSKAFGGAGEVTRVDLIDTETGESEKLYEAQPSKPAQEDT